MSWRKREVTWAEWVGILRTHLVNHTRRHVRKLYQMLWNIKITSRHKHGVVICLPKPSDTKKPTDFRPITLLNSEYKILTRLVAQSLRPVVEEHLANTQFCGIPGNTILDAVATVRDYIAFAEKREDPVIHGVTGETDQTSGGCSLC
jgi:hypothetical protein